jgi:hypothetical protein
MFITDKGANEFSLEELEELFKDETQSTTPATNEDTDAQDGEDNSVANQNDKPNTVEQTKAFATRLKESTDKARREERDAVAKELGYESYEAMQKERSNKMIQDKGLDPDEVTPIVEELVKQRLESDPRMQELESYRKTQLADFAKKELAEITELTNGEITKLSQLSKEVVERWKETGSLKSAFLEKEGENLIRRVRNEQSKGTTNHMQNMQSGAPGNSKQRPLTTKEKEMWRFFNPGISEEELNKKLVDK